VYLAIGMMAAMLILLWRLLNPIWDWRRTARALREYPRFLAARRRYQELGGSAPLREMYPQLHDRLAASEYDPHYFFQDSWAAQRVAEHMPERHVDVGSRIDLVAFLTAIAPVTFVDIRPLEVEIEGLTSVSGSVLDLPFEDRSLSSVSCLHVAEHIGLGRYGDPLDPEGTREAGRELQRVVAEGGQLLFSAPVGRPRTNFNAHRVHAAGDLAAMFDELELIEFSGVDDAGTFRRHRRIAELDGSEYAAGMFLLRRPTST
jgi:SAM-dependent methyltransferase